MAKKRFRIKDRSGNVVDYDVAASSVTLNDGVDVEQKIADIDEEVTDLSETRYRKPVNGIPRTDLDDDVNSSLDKADSAIQGLIVNNEEVVPDSTTKKVRISIPTQVQSDWNESSQSSPAFIKNKPTVVSNVFYEPSTGKIWVSTGSRVTELIDINTFFNSISYNSSNNIISFLNKRGVVVATLDASSFVVDKFVENVTLDSSTNELVITFNTASGKSPIRVPLGSISGQGTVQSVKMNGGTPIQPVNGVIDLGTVITEHQSLSSYATKSELSGKQDKLTGSDVLATINNTQVHYGESVNVIGQKGEKGDKGDTGNVQVDGNGNVLIYNGLDMTTAGAALDASQGQYIGKMLNTNDNRFYKVWVGTQPQLDALGDDYDDDTIYIVGTIPTPAVKYNVTFNGANCSSNVSAGQKVKENTSLEVEITPNTNYTIDTISVVMGNTTLNAGTDYTVTDGAGGKKTITIAEVTAAVSISASASVHLQSITVTQGTRTGNAIQMNAVLNPANADNVSLQWSLSGGSQYVTINQSTGLLTILEGASNVSVTVTCTDANSASGVASGTLQLTGLSYDDSVPLVSLGAVSYTAGAAANTYQFSVAKNPAGANTHSIKWDIDSVSPRGAATINADTGLLTITNDCEVVVSAKAYQGMAQDTTINTATSGSVQLTFDASNSPIVFEDPAMEAFMLNKVPHANANYITRAEAAAYTNNSFCTKATDNLYPFEGIKGSVTKFNEWQYFTGLTSINFENFSVLTEVTMPSTVLLNNDIYKYFNGTLIKRLVLPEGLTSFVLSGLSNSELEEIVFPSTLTSISAGSNGITLTGKVKEFNLSNTGLTTVDWFSPKIGAVEIIKFPPTLTTVARNGVGVQLLKNNANLNYIEFGTETGGSSLSELRITLAHSLSIILHQSNPPATTAFTSVSATNTLTVYVPDGSVGTYQNSTGFNGVAGLTIKSIEDLPEGWDTTSPDTQEGGQS